MESDVPIAKNENSSKGKDIVFESDACVEELNNEASNEVDDAPKSVVSCHAKKSNVGVLRPLVPTMLLPKDTLLLPQRSKKRDEDVKFQKFLYVFKTFSIKLSLVESLLEMPCHANFIKYLVTRKRTMDFETIEVSHSYTAIMSSNVVVKKYDPGAFTMPCTIGMIQFTKALCYLGESINLMPFAIFKQVGPVDKFIFSAYVVILDCEIDVEVPIILGRPFLATEKALVDMEIDELKFSVSEVSYGGEYLAAVLLNYDGEEIQDYDKVVAALSGVGCYSNIPLKVDINLKNRESPPAKPFIEEPPKLELKVLPPHLRYVFLEDSNTLPMIIVVDLLEKQAQAFVSVLKRLIKAIG
ncbi:uncharacterized protein [Solanum tuberosum]|uniref:uncharacterized protein n=1 Tax=Solanum tuberosum TaxID=4113 RepID=UPI00073A333D|nr:PREDICTED: uncharacterized protein LOC107062516 [Solanum tuberosum]